MKTFLIPSTATLWLAASVATAATFEPLVSPAELSARLDEVDPIVLDIRGESYADGHVAGAVAAPYALFRGPEDNPGQLPEEATLEERLEMLGLDPARPVVVVAEGEADSDFGAAARVYWTLKSSGFTDLSILNGGIAAWRTAGLPLDDATVTPRPTELDITFSEEWTADTEEVVAATRGEIDALLLDARPDDFYLGRSGHPAAARPGTLPGAKSHPHSSFFEGGSAAISETVGAAALRETLGIETGEEIVSFCNTGHWAATNWFALSELAGLENVKLYPGSMVEYSNAGLEMENAPGLLDNFLNRLRGY